MALREAWEWAQAALFGEDCSVEQAADISVKQQQADIVADVVVVVVDGTDAVCVCIFRTLL